jgi:hypothetical protein
VRPERRERRQQHEQAEEHVAGRIAEVPHEVPPQHGVRRALVHNERQECQQQDTDEDEVDEQEGQQIDDDGHSFHLYRIIPKMFRPSPARPTGLNRLAFPPKQGVRLGEG